MAKEPRDGDQPQQRCACDRKHTAAATEPGRDQAAQRVFGDGDALFLEDVYRER